MKMRMRWMLGLMTVGLAIAGCSRSQPSQYYRLESGAMAAGAAVDTIPTSGTLLLGLGPITLPGYLDRPQIVTSGDGHQMAVNDYSRWLEPLQESVTRVLWTQLQRALPEHAVVLYPRVDALPVARRVAVTIGRLDGTLHGEAVIEANYEVFLPGNELPRFGSFRATARTGGDYGSYAAALNQLVVALGQHLTEVLQQGGGKP